MRLFCLCLALLPFPVFAETLTLEAQPSSAVVYAEGAVVTRQVTIDIPAGDHVLVIPDMPRLTQPEAIDIALDGAQVIARQWTANTGIPYRTPRTPEWLAAKAVLDRAVEALNALDDDIALAEARRQAAEDQIRFLNGIKLEEQPVLNIDLLRQVGQLIASDGAAARVAITEAQAEARRLREARYDFLFDVSVARAALDALSSPNEDPATLRLSVVAPEAGSATLTLRYVSDNATWAPVYRAHLEGDKVLRIERGAEVRQSSGEDWSDVSLTLSTLSPFVGTDPSTLRPLLRRIEDDEDPVLLLGESAALSARASNMDMLLAEPSGGFAGADVSSVGVTYAVRQNISVPSGKDRVQIALDTLSMDASLRARAVPRFDSKAFRQVAFTNTTAEILLPGQATLFVDGQLVGITSIALLPPNAEDDIFFGPIEGLRLTRTVLDRNEGDRGIITRSNEEREDIQLEIENLTGRTWDVSVRENVPFSEQEDLQITWSANPAPTDEAVDDRRGILEWDMQIEPGETRRIAIETRLTWPEGMVLR